MQNKNQVSILVMNSFFDSVLSRFPESFRVYYPHDLPNVAHSIQGIMTPFSIKLDANFINQFPNLKIISCFGTGVDNVDKTAAYSKGIHLTNTPDVVTEDTADIAITLLLCLSRNIIFNDKYARSGQWLEKPAPLASSVTNKTVGIVGLGKIGKRIAERATVFGLNVIYHSRSQKNVSYEYYQDIVKLAESSDFLIVCCPGGDETRNIVNLKVLKALGPESYLINVSRGSTVNEDDLIFALENKLIAGAGLDVYLHEPRIPDQFLPMENVILLPHVGTATVETREKMLHLVVDNIISFFTTGSPLTPVKN